MKIQTGLGEAYDASRIELPHYYYQGSHHRIFTATVFKAVSKEWESGQEQVGRSRIRYISQLCQSFKLFFEALFSCFSYKENL